ENAINNIAACASYTSGSALFDSEVGVFHPGKRNPAMVKERRGMAGAGLMRADPIDVSIYA
ncbi:MAG: hypothetical protein KBE07_00330, partial [Rhodoferax sp.]|nr:hypothetical protein [Rhodoferax sp.]